MQHGMIVWEPFVETYHKMGWMIGDLYRENSGGHPSYLMIYPCECRLPYLKDRASHDGERKREQ